MRTGMIRRSLGHWYGVVSLRMASRGQCSVEFAQIVSMQKAMAEAPDGELESAHPDQHVVPHRLHGQQSDMAAESDRPRLVVFDFDGTLADSFPFFLRSFDVLAGRHGFRPILGEDLDALRGCDVKQIMRHVGIPLWKVPRVASDFRTMMASEIDDIPLFDGVGAMLHTLVGENVRLAVLSSNSESNVRAVLGPEHARLIECYACGASLFGKRSKLRRLLGEMNIDRRHALCVGDEVRDAEAARSERLRFGAVSWGYTRADVLQATRPDYLFRRVDDIAPALLGRSTLVKD